MRSLVLKKVEDYMSEELVIFRILSSIIPFRRKNAVLPTNAICVPYIMDAVLSTYNMNYSKLYLYTCSPTVMESHLGIFLEQTRRTPPLCLINYS